MMKKLIQILCIAVIMIAYTAVIQYELNGTGYAYALITVLSCVALLLGLCYIIRRTEKPITYCGVPYFRFDYWVSCGYEETDIFDAYRDGMPARESKRGYLYFAEKDIERWVKK